MIELTVESNTFLHFGPNEDDAEISFTPCNAGGVNVLLTSGEKYGAVQDIIMTLTKDQMLTLVEWLGSQDND